MDDSDPLAAEILAFWFGAPPGNTARDAWFRKDAAFDAEIRRRFGDATSVALAGGFGEWCVWD